MKSKLKWKAAQKKLSELKPFEKNPRRMTEKGMADLNKSLDKFGLADPIIINTDGEIIGGHARYFALKEKNHTESINVIIPDRKLTEDEVKELNVRLNKNIAGEWEFDILANEFELDMLLDSGFVMGELGMGIDKINELEEWKNANISDFVVPDKEFRIVIIFDTNSHRLTWAQKHKLKADNINAGAWTIRP